MNKKAMMMENYFNENHFPVGVYTVADDTKFHTVTLVAHARDGRNYIMNFDDTDLIKVCCPLFDGLLIDNYPTLYKLCHDLTKKYFSHSYVVDGGQLSVHFAVLASDESFSPEAFIGYCSVIDDCVHNDFAIFRKYFEDLRDAYAERAKKREAERAEKEKNE